MIEVNNLTMTYPGGKGIFNVNFRVEENSVYGYLGPNGAGKTTTIRNLLGFTNPDSGSTTIARLDCRKEAAKIQLNLGYLPGELAFFDHMQGMEFLVFIGKLRNMGSTKKRNDLISRFDLDPAGKIRKMSKGMKQKLGIVAAFMHNPRILILDEPTSGLDPLMQTRFMDLIDEEKADGKTILMSSHIFDEVHRSCDHVGIIREGRLVANEPITAITSMKEDLFVVQVKNAEDAAKLMNSEFSPNPVGQKKVQLTVKQNFRDFFALLTTIEVIGLEAKQQSLENVFMKYYGKADGTDE